MRGMLDPSVRRRYRSHASTFRRIAVAKAASGRSAYDDTVMVIRRDITDEETKAGLTAPPLARNTH